MNEYNLNKIIDEIDQLSTQQENDLSHLEQESCITPLTGLDVIVVTGADASTFLQSQFTLDVFSLTDNQSGYSAYCDAKGKIQYLLYLLKQNQQFSILCSKINSNKLLQTLKKYALFSKVQFKLNSEDHFLGTIGKPLLTASPTPKAQWQLSNNITLLQTSQNEGSALLTYYNKNQYTTVGFNAFTYAKIQRHIVDIIPETANQFTPHMLGMNSHNGLCFNKGCYLGQEVIARTEHLGKVKRKLIRITWKKIESTQIGAPLINANGRQVGTLLEYCHTKNQTCVGLACLKNEAINQTIFLNNQTISII